MDSLFSPHMKTITCKFESALFNSQLMLRDGSQRDVESIHNALSSLLPVTDSHPGPMLQLNLVQFIKNKAATTKNE